MLKLSPLDSAAILVGRQGLSDTILKGDPLRTIPSKFGPKLAKQFQRRRFLNIFPKGSYVKTKSADGGQSWLVGGDMRIQF